VREMVLGALRRSHAQIAVAVSGVAGPGGGTADKPVGTVCFGWARAPGKALVETRRFRGDRDDVRRRTVIHALRGILTLIA
jgi:nicotinamide-nucleotide amidase